MTRRAIAIGIGLALLGAYVVRASRGSGTLRMPQNAIPFHDLTDMDPDEKFQFTCPENWVCPDLRHPGTWRPPAEPRYADPADGGPREDPEVRV